MRVKGLGQRRDFSPDPEGETQWAKRQAKQSPRDILLTGVSCFQVAPSFNPRSFRSEAAFHQIIDPLFEMRLHFGFQFTLKSS